MKDEKWILAKIKEKARACLALPANSPRLRL